MAETPVTSAPSLVSATGDIANAINAGFHVAQPREIKGYRPYALVPPGSTAVMLDRQPELARPEHTVATPHFVDPASFIAYVLRFKEDATVIFADPIGKRVVAVIDYHEPGEQPGTTKARYGHHVATFAPVDSEEWETWIEKDGERMTQGDFGQFIEDNSADIQSPTGSDLAEMAYGLQGTSTGSFKSTIRKQDGSYNITFIEDNAAKSAKDVDVPKEFGILLRPFIGCEAVPMVARFRWRPMAGAIQLFYELLRPEQIQRDAFKGIVDKITADTLVPVFLGQRVHTA